MEGQKPILLVIGGPTAAGKTDLAIRIAEYCNTDIISFDSRQFYREMRIGTAVPDKDQLDAVKHHFIQHISIQQSYNISDYIEEANQLLNQLFKKHKILIAVGGSGLFIDALINGLDDIPPGEESIRLELQRRLGEEGILSLLADLREKDALTYNTIDRANPRRIIRALEVCLISGRPYSTFLNKKTVRTDLEIKAFVVSPEREQLYERINRRTEIMMEMGMEAEARSLYPFRHLNALNTVGYKDLFAYFEGKMSLEQAIAEIKKNTRRYAKRQITWFKRDNSWLWLSPENADDRILKELNV